MQKIIEGPAAQGISDLLGIQRDRTSIETLKDLELHLRMRLRADDDGSQHSGQQEALLASRKLMKPLPQILTLQPQA
jgi:hypothetical protein